MRPYEAARYIVVCGHIRSRRGASYATAAGRGRVSISIRHTSAYVSISIRHTSAYVSISIRHTSACGAIMLMVTACCFLLTDVSSDYVGQHRHTSYVSIRPHTAD
jgi:hypothetical protein